MPRDFNRLASVFVLLIEAAEQKQKTIAGAVSEAGPAIADSDQAQPGQQVDSSRLERAGQVGQAQ